MSNIVIYDPDSSIVPNRVTEFIPSANTPDYENRQNTLINPDLSAVKELSSLFWKFQNNAIVAMSADEQININNVTNSKSIKEKKFFVQVFDNQILQTETWYNEESNTGAYSAKVEESIYAYNDNMLFSKTTNTYYFDNTLASSVTESYFVDENSRIITKIS